VWTVTVERPGTGEFPPPAPATRYFLSVIPEGGPSLLRLARPRRYYTGDTINPLVELRYRDGSWPHHASASVTITRPDAGAGNLLSDAKLGAPITSGGDTIPARQATLLAIESRTDKPAVTYSDTTFALSQSARDTEGRMEEAAVFGKRLTDVLTMEGDYTFHFRASYGEECVATRELVWSLHVDVGIDPSRTDVVVQPPGRLVITPRDRFGNKIGPGRGDGFTVTGGAGTTVTGPVLDNGDGSYTVPVAPGPGGPSVVIAQPDRPPAIVSPPSQPDSGTLGGCLSWITIWILLAIIVVLLLVLWWTMV
jgi:hypothetical protein